MRVAGGCSCASRGRTKSHFIGAHATMKECSQRLVQFALFLSEKEEYVVSGLIIYSL